MTKDNQCADMERRVRNLTLNPECVKRKKISPSKKGTFTDGEIRRIITKQKVEKEHSTSHEPIIYRRALPRHDSKTTELEVKPKLSTHRDEKSLDGVSVSSTCGEALLMVTHVPDFEYSPHFHNAFGEHIDKEASPLFQHIASACHTQIPSPTHFLFMDIETTGLSSSPLFLIGIMFRESGGFEVRQYLARTYAEEAAVISFFIQSCTQKKLLITFNGKTFDVPYIRTRAAANGIPFDIKLAHFDLLHECRRIWKDVLPNCRLQTLEQHICDRVREGDIPGDQIPDVYHQYVRSGNPDLITEILKHNLLDLITMADLMTRFPYL